MDASPTPITFTQVPAARTGYGEATGVWASARLHQVEDDWWVALSCTPYVDYNLALLHGDSSVTAAAHVLEEIARADVPALIMLAGSGLAACGVLSDAGWACTGALPFMARDFGPAELDPDFRELEAHDLVQARSLAAHAFGVPDEVGEIVFAEATLGRPGAHIWGVFDGAELRCVTVTQWTEHYSAGWALSTAPEHQRAGYGRRVMRSSAARRLAEGPPVALLMATPAGRHLYEQEGYATLEHWQIWSRPRWMLP